MGSSPACTRNLLSFIRKEIQYLAFVIHEEEKSTLFFLTAQTLSILLKLCARNYKVAYRLYKE
jgi:hypothetical protein